MASFSLRRSDALRVAFKWRYRKLARRGRMREKWRFGKRVYAGDNT